MAIKRRRATYLPNWLRYRQDRAEVQDRLVLADGLLRALESALKVCEERVYRGCSGPASAADGIADFDGGAHVAAEGLFLHTDILCRRSQR